MSHLLDRLADAEVSGALRGLGERPDEAGPLAFAAALERPLAFPWFDGVWLDGTLQGPPPPPRAAARRLEGEPIVALAAADGGLHAFVEAPGNEPFQLHARVRAPAGSRGARLHCTPLAAAPPATPADLAPLVAALTPAELAAGRDVALPDDAAGEWRDLVLFAPTREGRRSLCISLLPSDGGLEIAQVELRRLSLGARVRATPRLAGDRSSHPLRRVVDVVDATCDALLVPIDATVAFAAHVPERRPRLRFVPGALGVDDGAPVDLLVRVDGAVAWSDVRPTAKIEAPGKLVAVEVDLAAHAGRSVRLEFTARSRADAVAWFGAPELLGGRDGPRGRNLLLVSLDTTRADHLGSYGDSRGLTPNLDAFAAEGTRFAQVIAPSCWTLPTHMSLMSGQHPILHGMIASPRLMDPIRTRLLSARLREVGYSTAAFTSGGPMVPRNGFGCGFDLYSIDDPCGLTKYNHFDPEVVAARASGADPLAPTLEWLRAHADQPFLLFVHTFFVHNYFPHREYLQRFADPDATIERDQPLPMADRAMAGESAALERLRDLYAACLLEVDATLIPRLLRELEALGIEEETIVCVLSDHGEEHLEHAQFGHRLELHRESTRVPWLLRGPGVPVGLVRSDPVDLADVSTTLARLLELPHEPLDFGRDQLAPGAGEQDALPHVQLFGVLDQPGSREALEYGPWKLMRWRRADAEPLVRLYHLAVDPHETRDVADEDPERLRTLNALLDQQLRALKQQADELPGSNVLTRQLKPAELERLRGLGYTEQ
ncbi:MAG: sulfatase [Planctomycetes bacterium]|nr:sulfatase [Planctomycetota bacterium]